MQTHLVGFALTVALVATAGAQGLQVDVTSLWARHELLGEPLVGTSVSARFANSTVSVVRLAFDLSRARAERTGSTCTGLIPPTGCPPERMSDESALIAGGVGLDVRAFRGGDFAFIPTLDARLAAINVRSHGETTGDELNASKRFVQLMAGAQVEWQAGARWAVRGGVDGGVMHPLTVVHIADGYTPLEKDFGFRRVTVGAIWAPRR
jgi:hypothetical protein